MSNGEKITPTLRNYLQRRGCNLQQLLQSNCCLTVDEAKVFLVSLDLSDCPSDKELHAALPKKVKQDINEVLIDNALKEELKAIDDSLKKELEVINSSMKGKASKKSK